MKDEPWTLEWDDRMSVGIPEIDDDHKLFITLVNQFNSSVADRMPISETKKCVRDILEFIERHISDEEKHFKAFGYPDLEEHTRTHRLLDDEMKDIMEGVDPGGTDYQWIEAGLKVKQLKIKHLVNEVTKFGEYFRHSQNPGAGQHA